jgi:hypothetical protein
MLKLINGTPPKPKRKFTADELAEKHFDMASKAITDYCYTENRWSLMKGCYNLVRYAIYRNTWLMESKAPKHLWVQFSNVISAIKELIGRLTPRELLCTFIPRKAYEEWDNAYFYTLDLFNGYDMDCPIEHQTADVDLVLVGYQNVHISLFNTACFYADDFAHDRNKFKDLVSYLDRKGIDYHVSHKDANGKEYVIDKNGRTSPLKTVKPRPKWLRVVK